jgi:predicted CXXCH cytochrome family protein
MARRSVQFSASRSRRLADAFAFLLGPSSLTLLAWTAPTSDTQVDWLHRGPGDLNHPVHVVPSSAVRIPEGWPLDQNGAITCTTCHSGLPFRDDQCRPRLRESKEHGIGSRSFCANCHTADGPRTAAGLHWLALGRAHLSRDSDDGTHSGGRLDAESRRCLDCHDGVTGPETAYETDARAASASYGDKGRNHPIGIPYPHGGWQRRGGKLHPPLTLPKTVRLPGGNVGCVSCHDLYAPQPKRLSVPIEGSALCFACHDMN